MHFLLLQFLCLGKKNLCEQCSNEGYTNENICVFTENTVFIYSLCFA